MYVSYIKISYFGTPITISSQKMNFLCDGVWVTYPQPLWLALHATIPVVGVFTGIVSNRVQW